MAARLKYSNANLGNVGTSNPILLSGGSFQKGVGLLVTLQDGVTATYEVQVCGDDPSVGLENWNTHDVLANMTASANSNIAYPVTAVRLVVLSYENAGDDTAYVVLNVVEQL